MAPDIPNRGPGQEEVDNRWRARTPTKQNLHGRRVDLVVMAPPPRVQNPQRSTPQRQVQWKDQQLTSLGAPPEVSRLIWVFAVKVPLLHILSSQQDTGVLHCDDSGKSDDDL